VLAYSAHQFVLLVLYWIARRSNISTTAEFAPGTALPMVTVQLPMYNEGAVTERLLRQVTLLDWTRERLQIQVLDDSTDSTTAAAAELCQQLRGLGHNIEYIHRSIRDGYKAGALANGMATARGEFIAILDAAFVPAADFLKQLIPRFADPKVGAVQFRWGHLNRHAHLLTQCQFMMIDGHFIVEYKARHQCGLFLNLVLPGK
jgi:cellulose synthase/poly-beta-1,6-N-acetylglucosamine synthase-like glycosyltransferase